MEAPPPPPHGHQYAGAGAPPPGAGAGGYPGGASGLPPGKYDIFVIPPHSSGSGFLYLPSLQPHRNSFLAGVACTLVAVSAWSLLTPVMKQWFHMVVNSGGAGTALLVGGVGVAGWAWGKTQTEGTFGGAGGPHGSPPGGGSGAYTSGTGPAPGPGNMPGAGGPSGGMPGHGHGPVPGAGGTPFTGHQYSNSQQQQQQQTPPKSSWQRKAAGETGTGSTPKGAWEKAREEARKREEERKKAEELRKKAEELLKKREEEEKERVRLREKEARERREREAREAARAKAAAAASSAASQAPPPKPRPAPPPQPTARTEADEETYSYRPYDKPRPAATARTAKTASSTSTYSEAWDAASQSTRRTTPPPSRRGPYSTKDPDKIVIRAVYAYTSAFHNAPIAQLVSGVGSVTDGLILRITTEGLFIDDDVRGVPQREWDVKAWTMKLVETGELRGMHVVRATIRDAEGKRYVFILSEEEGWKVAVGLQRLRRGTQVRSLGVSGLSPNETKAILSNMGFA